MSYNPQLPFKKTKKKRQIAKDIFSGYIHTISSICFFIINLLTLILLSIIIVFPLWFFSTEYKDVYTLSAGISIGSLIFIYFIFRIRRLFKESGIVGFFLSIFRFLSFLLYIACLSFSLILFILFVVVSEQNDYFLLKQIIFIAAIVISAFSLFILIIFKRKSIISPGFYKFLVFITCLVFIYWICVLFFSGFIIHAVITLFIFTMLFGYLLYGTKKTII